MDNVKFEKTQLGNIEYNQRVAQQNKPVDPRQAAYNAWERGLVSWNQLAPAVKDWARRQGGK